MTQPASHEVHLSHVEHFSQTLSAHMYGREQDLIEFANVFLGEMRFAHKLFSPDLKRLRRGAKILEIGAGSMMFSTVLQLEGFYVTALEPIGPGFAHFTELQKIVREVAEKLDAVPTCLPIKAEELDVVGVYDAAFSMNVMEHVHDARDVLRSVYRALAHEGVYHFCCPNYAFPYEPHFSIPTLLNKSLTESIFKHWILKSQHVHDPRGIWDSINWISTPAVRRWCQELGISASFERRSFDLMLARVLDDHKFRARHNSILKETLDLLNKLGMLELSAKLLPTALLPTIDCYIRRRELD